LKKRRGWLMVVGLELTEKERAEKKINWSGSHGNFLAAMRRITVMIASSMEGGVGGGWVIEVEDPAESVLCLYLM